jgi:hypothetical protein
LFLHRWFQYSLFSCSKHIIEEEEEVVEEEEEEEEEVLVVVVEVVVVVSEVLEVEITIMMSMVAPVAAVEVEATLLRDVEQLLWEVNK